MNKFYITLCLFIIITACKKDKDDPIPEDNLPTAAILIFPYENSECNEGTNVSDTLSTVLFEWEAGENTDIYTLIIENLNTNNTKSYSSQEVKIPVELERGTPYAWFVLSISNTVEDTAKSNVWKFFHAGDGIKSHTPFPADIVTPAFASNVNSVSGKISLVWEGSDIDDDITGYDIYFGSQSPPELFESNVTESKLDNVPVTSDTIYYWKVVTKDSKGNTSDSEISQFLVL